MSRRQSDRLPFPYRSEVVVVEQRLAALQDALDWAMESLPTEYPIASAEGLALMRLAEALLRVPDAETAIALTADQLGRADFDGVADSALRRLSSSAIALSKNFCQKRPDRRD